MIYLTGGTGLLGLHIIDEFRDLGRGVSAMARHRSGSDQLAARGATPHQGDVTDPASWRAVPECEAIVHSAAIIASPAGWLEYQRVNVEGTRLAVATALRLGVPLVHISSIAVYRGGTGEEPPGSVTEEYPIGSRATGEFYARSKRLAEDAVWEGAARGLRAVVLRPAVVYGEGDRLFLPRVLRHARRGVFPVVGSGREPLPLVEARNVAAAVSAALGAPHGWGRAYNIANDDEVTPLEFVHAIAEGLGRPVRPVHLPRAPAMVAAAALDLLRSLGGARSPGFRAAVRFLHGGNPFTSQAARERLGWRPTRRHLDALPQAVRSL